MCTVAGKFKVKNIPIPKEALDELARKLNLPDHVRQKLQGALMVEKLPEEEYTVEIKDQGVLLDTIKTKL